MKSKSNVFISKYFSNLIKTIQYIDINKLDLIINFIENKIKNNNQIFIAGNGGSSSIANHFLCDFNKGIKLSSKQKLRPKIISLANSLELITAISNDLNYNNIFSFQMENYYKKNDVLICISSSGKSKNIINALNFAKKNGMKTILFQGFGKRNNNIQLDYYINLKCKNYGITEDLFQSIMHIISQSIRLKYSSKKEIL